MLRRMALLYKATLTPSKLELLTTWLPGQSWYTGPAGELERVASFRFDDPAGAVGIETMLVQVGDGPIHQVPLTYRDAPLADDDALLTTAEHSVLGKRWIYDGTHDPLYAATLATAILANTGQAEQFVDVDGTLERREPSMSIASTAPSGTPAPTCGTIHRVADGDPTVIVTDTVELTVVRRLGVELTGTVLTCTWPGQETPVALASAH
jgi:maltokinase-like protein